MINEQDVDRIMNNLDIDSYMPEEGPDLNEEKEPEVKETPKKRKPKSDAPKEKADQSVSISHAAYRKMVLMKMLLKRLEGRKMTTSDFVEAGIDAIMKDASEEFKKTYAAVEKVFL